MSPRQREIGHQEAARVLHAAGIPQDAILRALAALPDPIDLDRDQDLLAQHGITRGSLIDAHGGSP